jgi:hypothetical protein
VNTETTGTVDVVTDPTLSKSLPINNIKVSGRSMSFDWKDPDGDYDHWRLELTGKNDGQIVWVGLPSDARVQPIPVSKSNPKSRYVAKADKWFFGRFHIYEYGYQRCGCKCRVMEEA